MQRKEFEKHWNQWKMNIQKHWNKLTADDLYKIDGMWDHFIGTLAHRYGYTREAVEKEIEKWEPREAKSDWESEGRSDESPETEAEKWKRKAHGGREEKIHEWKKPVQEQQGWQPPEGKPKKRKAG